MAVKAACAKFHVNFNTLFKLNQCLTVRKNYKFFSISSSKNDKAGRPKRPITPFFMYAQTVRNDLKEEYPDLTLVEISKKMGQQWQNLDASEKEKFSKEYEKKKEAYEEQLKLYFETADIEKAPEKEMTQKAMLRKLGKPKYKRTAINYYTKAVCTGDKTISFKDAVKMFSKLSPEEKEPYQQEAEHDAQRYLKEIKEWEEEMIKIGRSDLIRKTKR